VKQKISAEQLQELSEEQKEKLREWWFKRGPQEGDWIVNNSAVPGPHIFTNYKYQPYANINEWKLMVGKEERPREYLMILPNIGQMIELLEEITGKYPDNFKAVADDEGLQAFVDIDDLFQTYQNELCDALWEALKSVL
jgi:hypothetical protein